MPDLTSIRPRPSDARRRRTRIGRIVTDAPASTRLMLASGFFLLSGGTTLLVTLFAVVNLVGDDTMVATLGDPAPSLALRSAFVVLGGAIGGLYLWTGLLLGRGERRGSYVAAGILGLSFVLDVLGGRAGVGDLLFVVLGLAVLWSIRDEVR